MIEVQGLTKMYGAECAVDDISFEVKKGEVLGFLGPNGAGKSTTMKIITCYLPPSQGMVQVDGIDISSDPIAVRERIGYLPEHTPLYQEMDTYDYLDFVGAMRGIEKADRPGRIAHMAEVCGLHDVLTKRIEALSKGYRQRVGLAQAMIHNPPIVILDEPTSGLDPNQIVEIRELIRTIGQEKTVILSTHILSEVQASCDRVLIIKKGKLVADGTPDELQAGFSGGQSVSFGIQQGGNDARTALESWGKMQVISHQNLDSGETLFKLSSEHKEDLRPELFKLAVDKGWVLTELHEERANLEDVFRELTAN